MQEFSDPELEAVLSVGTGTQNYVASSVIAQYKECQIHGEVALNNDVAAFVINSKHRGKYTDKLEKLSQTHGVPVMWMDEVGVGPLRCMSMPCRWIRVRSPRLPSWRDRGR